MVASAVPVLLIQVEKVVDSDSGEGTWTLIRPSCVSDRKLRETTYRIRVTLWDHPSLLAQLVLKAIEGELEYEHMAPVRR